MQLLSRFNGSAVNGLIKTVSGLALQNHKAKTFSVMATQRVLVIDDEADIRAVVRGCLEDIGGWNVTTAESGKEGLMKVITDLPDAILLDLMMPEMDGLSFLRALRTYSKAKSIPVILLTAKVSLSPSNDLLDLNIKGVISKPFDPFQLVAQIASLLGWPVEAY